MTDKKKIGLTMNQIDTMREVSREISTNENKSLFKINAQLSAGTINILIAEVLRLGGPTCCDCRRNTARYDNGRCSLCDMKLPHEEQGKRA